MTQKVHHHTVGLYSYYQGGPTSPGARAYPEGGVPSARANKLAGQQQLVQVLTSLDQRFRDAETWAKELQVVQNLRGLERDLERLKKLKGQNGIR